jgi:hypothetical protein
MLPYLVNGVACHPGGGRGEGELRQTALIEGRGQNPGRVSAASGNATRSAVLCDVH